MKFKGLDTRLNLSNRAVCKNSETKKMSRKNLFLQSEFDKFLLYSRSEKILTSFYFQELNFSRENGLRVSLWKTSKKTSSLKLTNFLPLTEEKNLHLLLI